MHLRFELPDAPCSRNSTRGCYVRKDYIVSVENMRKAERKAARDCENMTA